jgi:serine/threonine-protein kinase
VRDDGPFEIRRTIAIADQIAQGLAAAHQAGIVHRDVKPENVFLLPSDRVKLLDFGISKFAEGGSGPSTQTGALMGSPHYMAPEQIADSSRVDARTDVYALGAVLYEMLAGHTLYSSGSFAGLVLAITQGQHRPVTESRSDVPAELSDLIARMVAREPDDRPQSMGEVQAALAPFAELDLEPRHSAPVPLVTRSHDTTPLVSESTVAPRVPTHSLARPVVFGLGLLGLAGIGGAVLLSGVFGERALEPAAAPSEEQPPIGSAAPDAGVAEAAELAEVRSPDGERSEPSAPETPPAGREAPLADEPRLGMRAESDVRPVTGVMREVVPSMRGERVDGVPLLDDY